jgi:hypothetical protein
LEGDHLEDLSINGGIILRRVLGNLFGRAWTELKVAQNWDHICTVVNMLIPLGFIKLNEFFIT